MSNLKPLILLTGSEILTSMQGGLNEKTGKPLYVTYTGWFLNGSEIDETDAEYLDREGYIECTGPIDGLKAFMYLLTEKGKAWKGESVKK